MAVMTPANPFTFGVEVAKALGLKVDNLYSFNLKVSVDDVVIVEACYHVVNDNTLMDVLKKYEVHVVEKETK